MAPSNSIDLLSLKSILTLRYDLSQNPILPKLDWNDYNNEKSKTTISILEDLIKKNIFNSVQESDPKKIAISFHAMLSYTFFIFSIQE